LKEGQKKAQETYLASALLDSVFDLPPFMTDAAVTRGD